MIRSPWLEIAIGAILAVLGCAVALILADPVRAQDIPACIDADAFVAQLKTLGAIEVQVIEYETRHGDKLRLIEWNGQVRVLVTNRGCAMFDMPIDWAKDRGDPA